MNDHEFSGWSTNRKAERMNFTRQQYARAAMLTGVFLLFTTTATGQTYTNNFVSGMQRVGIVMLSECE